MFKRGSSFESSDCMLPYGISKSIYVILSHLNLNHVLPHLKWEVGGG